MPAGLQILPVLGIGEVEPNTDLAAVIGAALEEQGTPLQDGDILVVTQKIVSKAEGCLVQLDEIEPSALATEWATRWQKDARVVELVLRESRRIVRMERGVISIVRMSVAIGPRCCRGIPMPQPSGCEQTSAPAAAPKSAW